ncbi:MAG TPA: hypothetical protein VI139_08440 [Gemmatimonadales bacterium]
MRAPRVVPLTIAAVALAFQSAPAQVTLTVTGAPVVIPAPATADYNAGFVIDPTGLGFTINVTGGAATDRTSIISIRSTSADFGGGKALSDLQWRRSDLATWNGLTGVDVTIESRTIHKNRTNDPWSNSIFFRSLLSWTADPPGAHSANLVITMTVTTP